MGHSQVEKGKTHQRIVAIAAKRFREEGLAGIGIAEIMKDAGLTVGGFYKHFDSREDLVAEAVGSALGSWRRRLEAAAASGGPAVTYERLVDAYLSEVHCNNPGWGCTVSALAGEIARSGERPRALVAEQIRNNIQWIASLLGDKDEDAARSKATLTFSAMVGAVVLARAVPEKKFAREIMNTVADRLKELHS
ncbi:MAG: TetR/AcrR family transcriptional regulator [Acidobacteriia bacterium]|nr:TetR/AcrR family transcriptional regulator [Terriglobia bacterium]